MDTDEHRYSYRHDSLYEWSQGINPLRLRASAGEKEPDSNPLMGAILEKGRLKSSPDNGPTLRKRTNSQKLGLAVNLICMRCWTLTDDQFIERVRKAQRYRRMAGAFCVFLGIVFGALFLYYLDNTQRQGLATLDEMQAIEQPTTQQQAQFTEHTQFYMGFGLGSLMAAGMMAAGWLVILGVVYLFTKDRKNEMLLRCWDSQHKPS